MNMRLDVVVNDVVGLTGTKSYQLLLLVKLPGKN